MATVTHYIYSHYDPEEYTVETIPEGQDENLGPDEQWQREAPQLSRLQGPAPQFVPATISYEDWSSCLASSSNISAVDNFKKSLGNSLSGWYRSLTNSRVVSSSTSSSSSAISPSSSHAHYNSSLTNKAPIPKNKNNWFITNAIQSGQSSPNSTPAPSLAEILSRDPPPLPSERKYTPPVWLEIGPSNKGFGMLQRAGWNEGEALGPNVVRRKPSENMLAIDGLFDAKDVKGKVRARRTSSSSIIVRQETKEVKVENIDGGTELQTFDVIDLSLDSDADSDSSSQTEGDRLKSGDASRTGNVTASQKHLQEEVDTSAYGHRALLTPIATVLKSDRLGIGLKAKTVGPYKASQKRVTHNAAVLAMHTKTSKESRRRRELFGRGRRGFERRHKKEEEHRQAMIAHLKQS